MESSFVIDLEEARQETVSISDCKRTKIYGFHERAPVGGLMAERYDIEVTVKSQKGDCASGHKVGDKIYFDGKTIRGEICYSALTVLLPKVFAMRFGIEFPWLKDKDVLENACPDAENPVVFEIKRIRK